MDACARASDRPVLVDRPRLFPALFAWYAVQVHQTKYLIELGFSPIVAAWALGMVSVMGIPGQIGLGARRTASAANGYGRRAARLRHLYAS